MDPDGWVVGPVHTTRESAEKAMEPLAPGAASLWQKKVTMVPVTDDAIYRVEEDCGRMGTIVFEFVCSKKAMARILADKPAIHAYEVLGKHSQIAFELNNKTVRMMSDDPTEVANHTPHGNVSVMDRLSTGWGFSIDGADPEESDEAYDKATAWFTDDR